MMSRITLILLLSIPFLLLGLVRFANMRILSHAQKTMLNFDEVNKRWVFNQWEKQSLSGADGPYLFWEGDSLQVVQVNADLQIQKTKIKIDSATIFTTQVANQDRDQFSFQLQPNHVIPPAVYEQPKRLLAISDIEGNFNAFYSLLVENGVMDAQYRWIFGDGHLVLLGDFVDRGDNVTQCLWLIYKLEQEALQAGGRVHYILGNHEVMNLEHDIRYVHRKYLSLAQQLSGKMVIAEAFPYLLSDENVLVQWLRTKNCIEKIGDALYVHGGISPELLTTKLKLTEINTILHTYLRQIPKAGEPIKDEKMAVVVGDAGPLWYRGLVNKNGDGQQKATIEKVNQALHYFKVKKIVVGHSIVENVSADYNGKVIRIDVKHATNKRTGKTQALLIENNKTFRVNDLGERIKLKK